MHKSVADVVDAESLAKVREFKQAAKAAAKAGSADRRGTVPRPAPSRVEAGPEGDQPCTRCPRRVGASGSSTRTRCATRSRSSPTARRCSARPPFLPRSATRARLSLLLALHHAGDLCVSDLAFAVGMTDSAVSHALRLLRAHGMVTAHRAGWMVHYRVAGELTARLLDVVSAEAVGERGAARPGEEHAI